MWTIWTAITRLLLCEHGYHSPIPYFSRFQSYLKQPQKKLAYQTLHCAIITNCKFFSALRDYLIVPDEHMAIVEGAQDPRLGGMNVHRLHTVRAGREFLLDFQTKRLREKNIARQITWKHTLKRGEKEKKHYETCWQQKLQKKKRPKKDPKKTKENKTTISRKHIKNWQIKKKKERGAGSVKTIYLTRRFTPRKHIAIAKKQYKQSSVQGLRQATPPERPTPQSIRCWPIFNFCTVSLLLILAFVINGADLQTNMGYSALCAPHIWTLVVPSQGPLACPSQSGGIVMTKTQSRWAQHPNNTLP